MRWDSEDCKRFFSFSSSVSFITHSAYDLVPPPAAAKNAFARTSTQPPECVDGGALVEPSARILSACDQETARGTAHTHTRTCAHARIHTHGTKMVCR